MPQLVRVIEGDDPRELAEKLNDQDAEELAVRVSRATGETVQLVAYEYDPKTETWSLNEKAVTEIKVGGAAPADDAPVEDFPNLDELSGPQLDALAAEKNVDGYKKSAKVDERRGFLKRLLSGA